MKKALAILVSLAMCVGLVACGSSGGGESSAAAPASSEAAAPASSEAAAPASSEAAPASSEAAPASSEAPAPSDDLTIGFFVKDNTNPFWRYVVNGAMKAGEDLGVKVIEYTPAEAQNVEQQVSLVNDAVQAGVDGIAFVAIDASALNDSIKAAVDAGVTVVPFNSRMDDLGLPTFVGCDNYSGMTLVMEAMHEKLGGGPADIVLLEGHLGGYANNERMRGVNDYLAAHPELNVVADQSGDGQRELTMTVMENILQGVDHIDAVICHNDNMAMGAYQAILDAGREDEMIVTGFDAQLEALESMAAGEGKIDITLDQSPYGQGYYAVEACVKILRGEEVPEWIPTGGVIVTEENAQEIIDQFYDF